MVTLNETVANNAILALWEITETKEELISLLNNNSVITAKIEQFGSEKRQLEFLATRTLLNEVLGQNKTIAYEANGQPYLTDHSYAASQRCNRIQYGSFFSRIRRNARYFYPNHFKADSPSEISDRSPLSFRLQCRS